MAPSEQCRIGARVASRVSPATCAESYLPDPNRSSQAGFEIPLGGPLILSLPAEGDSPQSETVSDLSADAVVWQHAAVSGSTSRDGVCCLGGLFRKPPGTTPVPGIAAPESILGSSSASHPVAEMLGGILSSHTD